jgi:hypothetical protein
MPNKKIPSLLENLEDCERPSCGDMQQMFRQQQQKHSSAASSIVAPTKLPSISDSTANCPADSTTLGRSSWTLLHSMVRSPYLKIDLELVLSLNLSLLRSFRRRGILINPRKRIKN